MQSCSIRNYTIGMPYSYSNSNIKNILIAHVNPTIHHINKANNDI